MPDRREYLRFLGFSGVVGAEMFISACNPDQPFSGELQKSTRVTLSIGGKEISYYCFGVDSQTPVRGYFKLGDQLNRYTSGSIYRMDSANPKAAFGPIDGLCFAGEIRSDQVKIRIDQGSFGFQPIPLPDDYILSNLEGPRNFTGVLTVFRKDALTGMDTKSLLTSGYIHGYMNGIVAERPYEIEGNQIAKDPAESMFQQILVKGNEFGLIAYLFESHPISVFANQPGGIMAQ